MLAEVILSGYPLHSFPRGRDYLAHQIRNVVSLVNQFVSKSATLEEFIREAVNLLNRSDNCPDAPDILHGCQLHRGYLFSLSMMVGMHLRRWAAIGSWGYLLSLLLKLA